MDQQKQKQLEELLGLFDERDMVVKEVTSLIADFITPTVLAALFDILAAEASDVTIDAIELIESTVSVTLLVRYDPVETKSTFLRSQPQVELPEGVTLIERTVRVGVPLDRVFDTKAEIITFLESYNNEPQEVNPEGTKPVPEVAFDPKTLTREQVESMLFFQRHTKGITQ